MNQEYKFDKTARTERYLVNTLFTHLLMADNFSGLKEIFRLVFSEDSCATLSDNDDFEIVSELDALRDGSIQHPEVKKLYRELKRVAVPDLFLRWSSKCLIIEAKFFTEPSNDSLERQVQLQKDAINSVKKYTAYKDYEITFSTLTINPPKANPTDTTALSWDNILKFITVDENSSKDKIYAKDMLNCALRRAKEENRSGGGVTYEMKTYDQLMSSMTDLIKDGKIFIGFTGGPLALLNAKLDELKERSHYKVSSTRWSDNWISVDVFLNRIFQLRGLFDEYDDSSE